MKYVSPSSRCLPAYYTFDYDYICSAPFRRYLIIIIIIVNLIRRPLRVLSGAVQT